MKNLYLHIPLSRVKIDALDGVRLAREALAERDPDTARSIGIGLTADEARQARILAATADFLAGKSKAKKLSRNFKKKT